MTGSMSKRRNLKESDQSLSSNPNISNAIFVSDFKPDEPAGRCCVASNYDGDWLLFVDEPPYEDHHDCFTSDDEDYGCFLWNPQLRSKVQLPLLPNWCRKVFKFLVSCYTVPLGGGSHVKTKRCCYTVYVFYSTSRYMWCSDEFTEWKDEKYYDNLGLEDVIDDVVLFGPSETTDCICGITGRGLFYSSNLQMQPPSTFEMWKDNRLVVYRGEERDRLFLVQRKLCSWEVWEVDFLQRSWISVSNLEGIVVFLNGIHSAAYSYPALEGNCICFTSFGDTENFFVLCLADKSICAFKNQPHSGFPAWFPNLTSRTLPWLSFLEKYVQIIDQAQTESVTKPIPKDNVMNGQTALGSSESGGGACGNVYLELPHDLQRFIAEYLSAMEHANLRLVSRILREKVPPIYWKPDLSSSTSIQFPWLMLFGEQESCSSIIDPTCDMKYYYSNQELLGCEVRYCNDGWLLVTQGTETVFFIEPFSKIKISLPNLPDGSHILSMSFSTSPASSDWIIISTLTMLRQYHVMYLRSTSDKWNIIPHQFGGYGDCPGCSPLFHDHSFYLLSWRGSLVKFWWEEEAHELRFRLWQPDGVPELVPDGEPVLGPNGGVELGLDGEPELGPNGGPELDPDGEPEFGPDGGFEFHHDCHLGYLVSCENDLYLIVVAPLGKTVNMYKQNEAAAKWDRVENMENFSFFISRTSSLAIPISQGREQRTINLSLFVDSRHIFYNLDGKEFRCSGDDSRSTEIYERKEFLNGTWIQPQVIRGYRYSS